MKLNSGQNPEGFLIINKPSGQTSFRVLRDLSRQLGPKIKAGHAGTLDSFATGVLLCLFGRYTRLSDYFMASQKSYRATVQFGQETDTLDPEGKIVRHAEPPSRIAIEECLPLFRGKIQQIPPVYSALHVDGKRAYERVRKGEILEMKARPVVIESLELVSYTEHQAIFDITCSKGTYIRSMARDIAAAAGSCGYLAALCRTASGPFTLDKAYSPSESSNGDMVLQVITPELVENLGLHTLFLDKTAARDFTHGLPLHKIPSFAACQSGQTGDTRLAFDEQNNFLGIIRYGERGWEYAYVFAEAQ